MNGFLLVGLGGAMGSMARYGLGLLVGQLWRSPFPLATFLVNIIGATVMGLFIGSLARWTPPGGAEWRLFVAVGLLGGFTTFSSFSLDTVTLIERGAVGTALIYLAASVAVCLGGLYLGLMIMRGSAA